MKSSVNSKDRQWLSVCDHVAQLFSTCTRRKYAALIIAKNGRIIGMGYNGSAPNTVHCNEGGCPRANMDVKHGSVYDNCIAIHAEANAIMWSDISIREGATLVVNGPPCYGCAKLIASSGIKEVVCLSDPEYAEFEKIIEYFNVCGINVKICTDFESSDVDRLYNRIFELERIIRRMRHNIQNLRTEIREK